MGPAIPYTQLSPKAGFGTCTILQAKIDKYIHNSYGDQMARMIKNKKMSVKEISPILFLPATLLSLSWIDVTGICFGL